MRTVKRESSKASNHSYFKSAREYRNLTTLAKLSSFKIKVLFSFGDN